MPKTRLCGALANRRGAPSTQASARIRQVLRDQFQGKTAADVAVTVIADAQALAATKPAQGETLIVLGREAKERGPEGRRSRTLGPGGSGPAAHRQPSNRGSRIKASLKCWLVLKTWRRISVVLESPAKSCSALAISGTADRNRSRLASAMPGSAHRGRTASSRTASRATSGREPAPALRVKSARSRLPRLGISNAQPSQPVLDQLGNLVVRQKPAGSHPRTLSVPKWECGKMHLVGQAKA